MTIHNLVSMELCQFSCFQLYNFRLIFYCLSKIHAYSGPFFSLLLPIDILVDYLYSNKQLYKQWLPIFHLLIRQVPPVSLSCFHFSFSRKAWFLTASSAHAVLNIALLLFLLLSLYSKSSKFAFFGEVGSNWFTLGHIGSY